MKYTANDISSIVSILGRFTLIFIRRQNQFTLKRLLLK